MKNIILLLVYVFISLIKLSAQIKAWDFVYLPTDPTANNFPVDQVIDSNNNLFVAGYERRTNSFSTFVFKINWSGNIEWVRKFNSPNLGNCGPIGLELDSQNNIIATGYVYNINSGLDIFLLKYNQSGDVLFQQTWSSEGSQEDIPKDFIVDHEDNIYVGVKTTIQQGSQDLTTLKFSPSGELIWGLNYSDSSNGLDNLVLRKINDTIYELGYTQRGTSSHITFLQIDSQGNLISGSSFSDLDSDYYIHDRQIDNEGNPVILVYDKTRYSYLIKFDKNLEILWEEDALTPTYLGTNKGPKKLSILPNNNYVVFANSIFGSGHYFTEYIIISEFNCDGINLGRIWNSQYELINKNFSMKSNSETITIAKKINNVPNDYPVQEQELRLIKISDTWSVVSDEAIFIETMHSGIKYSPLKVLNEEGSNSYILGKISSNSINYTIIQRYCDSINQNDVIRFDPTVYGYQLDNQHNISWTDLGESYSYRLMVSLDSLDFSELYFDEITDTNYITVELTEEKIPYYCKVIGFDSSQVTRGSDITWFDFDSTSASADDPISGLRLFQNYPNPFNPNTKIRFTIQTSLYPSPYKGEGARLRLSVYDVLGREVMTLINKPMRPGIYEVEFDGSDLPSGVYFYRLNTGEFELTKKMLLLK